MCVPVPGDRALVNWSYRTLLSSRDRQPQDSVLSEKCQPLDSGSGEGAGPRPLGFPVQG